MVQDRWPYAGTTASKASQLAIPKKRRWWPRVIESLHEFLLDQPIAIEVMDHNAAAIAAAQKGYSPRLGHLHQTKRVHVGFLGEVFDESSPQAKLVKVASVEQKGDILTKELENKASEECKTMLQSVPQTCCLP